MSKKTEGTPEGRYEIGKIVGAHGVRGDMLLLPLTDFPERFLGMKKLDVTLPGKPMRAYTVSRIEPYEGKNTFFLRLLGVEGRDAAEAPKPTMSLGARRVALDTLSDVHQRGAYASLALQKRLNESRLSAVDKRLCTALVYGVLENQIKLDYALDKLMDRPTNEAIQRDILRLGAYQILLLDRVPDSAAVDESVKLVKAMGMEGASGFLNAVLRNLSRGKGALKWPRREEGLEEYLRVEYSQPLWIVQRILHDYGAEEGEQILSARSDTHETVIRANLMRITDEALEKRLTEKEWSWRHGVAPHAILVSGVGDPTLDDDYRKGLYSVQGQSSILAAICVGAKNGMHVLDACAAPGGKACYMAETMQGTGRVFAWDLHEHRVKLMESAKRRLGLENLRLLVRDATEHREDLDATMDAVLLDAPCSGLGVADDKPDLKYRITEQNVQELVETQQKLLDTVCQYVKPGGVLVYSTCTLLKDENEHQIEAFLARHPEYHTEPLPEEIPAALRQQQTALGLQLLPGQSGVEGFYMARMRRDRA